MAYAEVTFEIKKHIGVIEKHPTGWLKELNLVSWNGNAAKFDIRDWDPEHERMARGITLTEEQARIVCNLLNEYFGEE